MNTDPKEPLAADNDLPLEETETGTSVLDDEGIDTGEEDDDDEDDE